MKYIIVFLLAILCVNAAVISLKDDIANAPAERQRSDALALAQDMSSCSAAYAIIEDLYKRSNKLVAAKSMADHKQRYNLATTYTLFTSGTAPAWDSAHSYTEDLIKKRTAALTMAVKQNADDALAQINDTLIVCSTVYGEIYEDIRNELSSINTHDNRHRQNL